ncbi:hypothetical protein D3C80_2128640 [compost metagenome]
MVIIFLLQQLVGIVHAGLVDIAECSQLRGFVVVLGNGPIEKLRSSANANLHIFLLRHENNPPNGLLYACFGFVL